jgi:hypothetical protein
MNAHPPATRLLEQADANLKQALRLLAANDRRGAEQTIALAEAQLADIERGQWQAAVAAFPTAVSSPLCTQFSTLPAHYALSERLRTATFGANLLAGGTMEDLNTLLDSGWRQQRDPSVPLEATVEFAPQPHTGQSALHLKAFAARPEEAPAVIETPPVWVISPPLAIGRGKLLHVSGFARTSEIAGSPDGLLIFDSLGGQALATRINAAATWQPFSLFRAVGDDASVSVTFALTGIGEAWLDDVEIRVLDLDVEGESPNVGGESFRRPKPAEEIPVPTACGWLPRLR